MNESEQAMKRLTELKAISMAATPDGTCNLWHPRDHNNWKANQAFCDAMDAKTALALIAVAEAAMKWGDTDVDDKVGMLTSELTLSNAIIDLRAALDQLEGK
jgi:hypothetical protein